MTLFVAADEGSNFGNDLRTIHNTIHVASCITLRPQIQFKMLGALIGF